MNIRDLQYLVALSEEGNFGRASERCFVSQPTLSMQVKKLEEELGVELFERGKRFVRATTAGDSIVDYAKQVLQLVEDMKLSSQAFLDPFAGTLKLGIFPTLAPYILPHLVKTFKRQLPALSMQLYEQVTEECIQGVLSGDLDAVLLATDLDDPRLCCCDLFVETFYLVCDKKHTLNQYDKVTASRLPEDELLLLQEGHCLREQGLEYCQRIGKRHNTAFAATSLLTVLSMVALGEVITLIPALSVDATRSLGVSVKPFSANAPARKIQLYWRKSVNREPLFLKIVELIQGALEGRKGVKIL